MGNKGQTGQLYKLLDNDVKCTCTKYLRTAKLLDVILKCLVKRFNIGQNICWSGIKYPFDHAREATKTICHNYVQLMRYAFFLGSAYTTMFYKQ